MRCVDIALPAALASAAAMHCKAYMSLWACRAQAEDEATGARGKPSCALTLMIRARDEDVRAQREQGYLGLAFHT